MEGFLLYATVRIREMTDDVWKQVIDSITLCRTQVSTWDTELERIIFESSQISCPLKMTSFFSTPHILTESISFLKQAYTASHTYPGLFGWGGKNPANQQAGFAVCSSSALWQTWMQFLCLPTLPQPNKKKLPDKGNSFSVLETASHFLAWKGPIHILFLTAFT